MKFCIIMTLFNSSLRLLPSFRSQIKDSLLIFAIMAFVSFLSNANLAINSNKIEIALFVSGCCFMTVLGFYLYVRFMPVFLKAGDKMYFYIGAFIEYLIVTIGFCPLYLYLFVEMKWFMLNKYGWECLFLFNTYTNWLLPGIVFATISCIYWLIVHLILKESKMFYLLEKKKKEIYEL